ncbi:hypothetical protein HJFPF1_02101 [Paramyrothecium foliicola]|nr:hypothetical protein HJFPF1_02101 [Paramyrothecium foliicola]
MSEVPNSAMSAITCSIAILARNITAPAETAALPILPVRPQRASHHPAFPAMLSFQPPKIGAKDGT